MDIEELKASVERLTAELEEAHQEKIQVSCFTTLTLNMFHSTRKNTYFFSK